MRFLPLTVPLGAKVVSNRKKGINRHSAVFIDERIRFGNARFWRLLNSRLVLDLTLGSLGAI